MAQSQWEKPADLAVDLSKPPPPPSIKPPPPPARRDSGAPSSSGPVANVAAPIVGGWMEEDRQVHEKQVFDKKSTKAGKDEAMSFPTLRKKATGIRKRSGDGDQSWQGRGDVIPTLRKKA